MVVSRPFRRTVRQFTDGSYAEGGRAGYIRHPRFALDPEHYVRAFFVIQKDLLELFDYIEPADANRQCYSYRIHELFIRACIEVEANFKAILSENGYTRGGDWNMRDDYRKCEASHFMSAYQIKLPVWGNPSNPIGRRRTISTTTWTGAASSGALSVSLLELVPSGKRPLAFGCSQASSPAVTSGIGSPGGNSPDAGDRPRFAAS
jgi:hypothetical protein